ncbi:MAG: serine/threonine-protein kinase, partial [Planctomycetota bacterium]|nr:serine/threonine-protein kinase [Planctomycetota bacterium]
MKQSIDSEIARKAVQFGFMTEAAASYCFEMARQQRKPFLLCAIDLGGLSEDQAQQLVGLEDTARRLKVMPIPRLGETVDGYEILERLGQGGMGCVYKARRMGEDRYVAVKFLIESDEKARARLAREAEALAQVGTHSHVVGIHGVGSYGQDVFLILDYVRGEDLAAFVKRTSLDPDESLKLVIKIARAVHYIHSKNILHRDLKPANILIREADDEPILTDFGLAKSEHSQTLTQSEELLGTPYYMSPEQADGQNETLVPASEVFSLGVILYELLTGVRPFQGQSFYELVGAILNRQATRPSILAPTLSGAVDAV